MLPHRSRLGIVHHSTFGQTYDRPGPPLYDSLRRVLLDDRFDAVEVDYIDDPSLLEGLQAVLTQADVEIVVSAGTAMNRGNYSLCSTDERALAAAVAQAREIIDFCRRLGAAACVFPSGKDPGPDLRPAAYDRFVHALGQLCDYAAQTSGGQLWVTVEPLAREFAQRHLIGPTEEAVQALQAVRRDYANAGLTFDLSHTAQLREDPARALALMRDLVWQIHLANCVIDDPDSDFYGDKHPPFGVAAGTFDRHDLADFLRAADDLGLLSPTTICSLEVKTPAGCDPWVTLADAKRALFAAWAAAARD